MGSTKSFNIQPPNFSFEITDADISTIINDSVSKEIPSDEDVISLSDSADENKLKKITFSSIKQFFRNYFDEIYVDSANDTDAFHKSQSAEINALSAKTVILDADISLIEDSQNSNAKRKITFSSIWNFIKTKADTFYATINHNHSTVYEPYNTNIQSHIANPDIHSGSSTSLELFDFYPSSIMDKTIINNTVSSFNASSFTISSINFTTYQVVIDTNIVLPLFEEIKNTQYCKTWQIHKKSLASNDANSVLQLNTIINANTFSFIIVSGQNQTTLQSNFTAGSNISFRNPHTLWLPLRTSSVCNPQAGDGLPTINRWPHFLVREGSKFKMYGFYNDGATDTSARSGYSESTDFISWSNPVKLTPSVRPAWVNQTLDISNFVVCGSNVIIDNYYIVPFIGWRTTAGTRRIGLMKIPLGFTGSFQPTANNFSTTYLLNGNATYDTASILHLYSSFVQFENKLYLAMDIYGWSPKRKVAIFSVNYVDINNVTLTEIDNILPDSNANGWKNLCTTNPCLFVAGRDLFCLVHGVSSTYSYIYPNQGNVNGLYKFDKSSNKFVEYISNPCMLNPALNAPFAEATHHSGIQQIIYYNNEFYSLITMSAGTNTYRIFPVKLNLKNKYDVDQWLVDNKLFQNYIN